VDGGYARADSEGRKNEGNKYKLSLNKIKNYKLRIPLRGGARSWGKDPSFPQKESVPEHPLASGKCEEKHRTK